MVITIAITALTAVLVVVVCWFSAGPHTRTPFGVRVPAQHARDEVVTGWTRRYRSGLALAGAAYAATSVLLVYTGLTVLTPIPVVLFVAVAVALFAGARAALLAAKRDNAWYAGVRQGAAADLSAVAPRFPWGWLAPSAVVVAATAALGLAAWPGLPAEIAVHFDESGTPDRYALTTALTAFTPVLVQLLLTLLVAGCVALSLHSPATIDPAAPEESARHQRDTRRRMLRAVLLLAAFADLSLLVIARRTWQGGTLTGSGAVLAAGFFAAGLLVLLAEAVRAGRSVAVAAGPGTVQARDDDAYWKGGLVYCNRDDPAFLVPKRIGLGWTVNLGHRYGAPAVAALVAGPMIPLALSLWQLSRRG